MRHLLPLGRDMVFCSALPGQIRRPPLQPVMRTQLAPPHLPMRDLLNANTLFRRHIAMAFVVDVQQPMPNRHRGYLQFRREGALASSYFNGTAQRRKVGGFHGCQ